MEHNDVEYSAEPVQPRQHPSQQISSPQSHAQGLVGGSQQVNDQVQAQSLSIRPNQSTSRTTEVPLSPVRVERTYAIPEPSSAQVETWSPDMEHSRSPSGSNSRLGQYAEASEATKDAAAFTKPRIISSSSAETPAYNYSDRADSPQIVFNAAKDVENKWHNENGGEEQYPGMATGFQYHHERNRSEHSESSLAGGRSPPHPAQRRNYLNASGSRPGSSYSAALENGRGLGRDGSPNLVPRDNQRAPSSQGRRSPDTRPLSYVDLLSLPYSQQAAPTTNFNHSHLKNAVGSNASLLSSKQTLEMYRANVKKTNDPATQYSFAIFMLEAAQDARSSTTDQAAASPAELILEARQILQRLADRSYPFAQYYLADGFASGVFNKGKEDNDKAFPLFVAASKHGHAEAGYRAALCYEFGWGTRKDPLKAVQFYRQSASKNHPGAMVRLGRACMTGDLGLGNRYREGVKWLKRATESADTQYNTAPYELGVLHETGYGDDIFRDETYAAQLFTQSADLGHPEASFRLGDAYEHGKLNCPRDPALSVHFYNGAASRGHPQAMMALCAWYMVGAEPVLEKDENEAYEWAKRAAQCGLPKAEYAVGYFTEMGIGCRRDPLEANVWYVKAADQGDERAKHRIAAIQAAASGGSAVPDASSLGKARKGQGQSDEKEKTKGKKWGLF